MYIIIKINQKFFKQILYISIIIGISTSSILFIFSSLSLVFIYAIGVVFVFFMLIGAFYFNRHNPERIIIKDDCIIIDFFNKFIFKNSQVVNNLKDVEFVIKNNTLFLKRNCHIMAKIKKSSVNQKDWNLLIECSHNKIK